MVLQECKYVIKEKKYTIDDRENSSDSDRKTSDEENSDEENKQKTNITINFYIFLYTYIKMVNQYYQKKNKENLQKEARERYQNLSEEEKEKR